MVIQSGQSPHAPTLLSRSLSASVADGNGGSLYVAGHSLWQHVELVKTGAGTCSVVIEGSDDDVAFYPVRYQQMDVEARPVEADVALAQAGGAVAHVYQILDRYPWLRLRQTTTVGAVVVNGTIYAESGGRI